MKTTLSCIASILCLLLLFGCKRPRHEITGEIKLAYVGYASPELKFILKNQTSKPIAFSGARQWWWQDAVPQVPRFQCTIPGRTYAYESLYPLIDGPAWENFVIDSGEEQRIGVHAFYLKFHEGKVPNGNCRFRLEIYGGAIVDSDEFESAENLFFE